MATYQTIGWGSNGDDVKRWQEYLNTKGYGLTVDGNFGNKTREATINYQRSKGLTTDGIVGNKTWATYAAPTASGTATASAALTSFAYPDYKESDDVVALGKKASDAESAVAGYGDFNFSKQGEYDTILDQYKNRKDFTYDFNADALYQMYKDKYISQGKMAMADAMGQASAMTGGYGNSYAATVGNQAYQAQLQNLNDVIPELYQLAYDKYNQEGQDMLNKAALLGEERNFEYGKWGDGYNMVMNDRDYYGTKYDNAKAFDYDEYATNKSLAYQQHADDIENEQWDKMYELEKNGNTSSGSSSSGSDSTSKPKNEGSTTKYEAVNTVNTSSFKSAIRTRSEFNRGTNSDKTKYKTYEAYIDGKLDEWYSSGKLNESEVATLIKYYGLA